MGSVLWSVVINGIFSFFAFSDYPIIATIMAGFVGLAVVGVVFILGPGKKVGVTLVMIGCGVFVPVGFIGVYGARKIQAKLQLAEFNAGRMTEKEEQAEKIFYLKLSIGSTQMNIGIGILCLGLLMILLSVPSGSSIGLGIFFMIFGMLEQNRKLLSLHKYHLEMKLALLGKTTRILYSDMTSVEKVSSRKAILHYQRDGIKKETRIPLRSFESSAREELLEAIEKRLKHNTG